MSEIKKFEDLNKEQQDTIKKAGKKFILDGLFTGMNYGGLLGLSNLCLILANGAFFHSDFLMILACVVVDFKLLRMMGRANRENSETFRKTVEAALKN